MKKIILSLSLLAILIVSAVGEPLHKIEERIEKRHELWAALEKECQVSKWNVRFDEIRLYVECGNLQSIFFFVGDQPYSYSLDGIITKSRLEKEGINRLSTETGKWGEYVILWSNGKVVTSIKAWSSKPKEKL